MTARFQSVLAAAIAFALLISYVVITVSGHDGTALLALLVGYIGGAAPPAVLRAQAEAKAN